jgi:hypothetical protein
MMQQGAGGMTQAPSGGPAPPQWGAIPPPMPTQYQQPHPQAMWGQQPSQIPAPLSQQYGVAMPPQAAGVPSGGSDEVRTLWIGDLQYWMDDNYIYSCFAQTGEVWKAILVPLGYLLIVCCSSYLFFKILISCWIKSVENPTFYLLGLHQKRIVN